MKRRKFIKTIGAGVAASAGVFSILKYPRGAHAAGWGAWPIDKMDALLPVERRAQKVLEIHINGGLDPWDTFYTVPSWGQPTGGDPQTGRFIYQFGDGVFAQDEPDLPTRFTTECGYGSVSDLWETFGAVDGAGTEIFLGPWLLPLRARPDILDRMRIVVQRHDQVAHEGANPISFTGDRLGQPRMAGIGTAIQRFFSENPEVGGGVRAAPYAYILYPGAGFNTFNSLSASAVGFHPGSARPLGVTVNENSLLNQLLARPSVADRDAFDDAIAIYRADYERRFRPDGLGAATRSPERDNFEFADFARRNASQLQQILSADLFAEIPSPANVCNDTHLDVDMPRMQARLAASLLTRPTDQARYVMWIDTGIRPTVNGGHDTHFFHTRIASQNIPHTFAALMEIINLPGEGDPDKIDLEDTLVIINCEFGRTPYRQASGGETGTNHWPQGYVNVMFGGPVGGASGNGRSVYGYISEAEGIAQDYVTPAENRMMVMQALGIYPFSSQSFAVGDVRGDAPGEKDELWAATRVRDLYLGVQP